MSHWLCWFPRLFLCCEHEVQSGGCEWNILTTIGWLPCNLVQTFIVLHASPQELLLTGRQLTTEMAEQRSELARIEWTESFSSAYVLLSCLTSNVDSLSVLFTYDMRVFFFPLCYKVYEMCFICLLTIPIFTFFFLFYLNFEDRQRTRQLWESQKNPAVFLYLPGVRIFLFFFFFTIVLCF